MDYWFADNYCRLCDAFFCCVPCRSKHEESIHNIEPTCEICVYGRTYLKTPTELLLNHWKAKHWPLHCVLCKKVFITRRDLTMHCKCQISLASSENYSTDVNYDSPPISATFYTTNKDFNGGNHAISVTTSTPMHQCNERELIESIPVGITPGNDSENVESTVSIKSQYTPVIVEETKHVVSPVKRRVTFCETPIINYESDQESSLSDKKYESFTTANEELIEENIGDKSVLSHNEVDNGEKLVQDIQISDIAFAYNANHRANVLIIPKVTIKEEFNSIQSKISNETCTLEDGGNVPISTGLEYTDTRNIRTDSTLDTFTTPNLKDEIGEGGEPSTNEIIEQTNEGNISGILKAHKHEIQDKTLESFTTASEELIEEHLDDNSVLSNSEVDKQENLVQGTQISDITFASNAIKHANILIMPRVLIKAEFNLRESKISNETCTLEDRGGVLISTGLECTDTKNVTADANPDTFMTPNLKVEFGEGNYNEPGTDEIIEQKNKGNISATIQTVKNEIQDRDTSNVEEIPQPHDAKISIKTELQIPPHDIFDDIRIVSTEEKSTPVGDASYQDVSLVHEKPGIWNSVANMVKNAVKGFSKSTETFTIHPSTSKKPTPKTPTQKVEQSEEHLKRASHKRSKPETEISTEEIPQNKRIKLSDIKCRRTIHHLGILYIRKKIVTSVNKGTQTD